LSTQCRQVCGERAEHQEQAKEPGAIFHSGVAAFVKTRERVLDPRFDKRGYRTVRTLQSVAVSIGV
jgi:hypothetical protein